MLLTINCGFFARDVKAEAESGSGGKGCHSGLKRKHHHTRKNGTREHFKTSKFGIGIIN